MVSLIFPTLLPHLLLLVDLLFYFATSSSALLPSLLAFNCTLLQTEQQSIKIDKPAFDPTKNATQTGSITNSTEVHIVEPDRPTTTISQCSICIIPKAKRGNVSMLCPESEAVTARFDSCYVHYLNRTYHVVDHVRFNSALDTFLLQLRAIGLTDCIRLAAASLKDCEFCVKEGIKNLKQLGTFVDGYYVVRLGSRSMLDSGGGGSDVVSYYDESEVDGNTSLGFKRKAVWWGWGVGVACLIGVGLGAWLMRRNVINAAKVAANFSDSTSESSNDEYINHITN